MRPPHDHTGCIVSWVDGDGYRHVRFRPGELNSALQTIVNTIGEGSTITSISTARSVRSDLARTGATRRTQYAFEYPLLKKIGRLDLLPEGAR